MCGFLKEKEHEMKKMSFLRYNEKKEVKTMRDFGELITSMITPFDQNLKLDPNKTKQLVELLIQEGTDAVIVGGVTGEGETLSRDEKLMLFKTVKSVAHKRLKVIASVTMITIDETKEFISQVDELGYADAIFVTIPYYIGLDQEGIVRYIEDIVELTDLPILLYNGPIKTGVYIEPETVIRLSKIKSVIGIQEASEDLPSITNILAGVDDDFAVYAGDDRYALPILSIGAKGVVSVASHMFGRKIKEMIHYHKRGQTQRASEYHQELSTLAFDILHQKSPTFVKHILKARHLDMGNARNVFYEMENEDDMLARIVFGGVF